MNSVKTISLLIMLLLSVVCGQSVYSMDIFQAIKANNLRRVDELIKTNPMVVATLGEHRASPLLYAAREGNIDVVKMLIGLEGVDLERRGGLLDEQSPLCWAAENGHIDVLKELVRAGANVNSASEDVGNTPLHLAVLCGDVDIMQYLIEAHANINAEDCKGCTPLYDALRCGRIDVVCVLIYAGADVNWQGEDLGRTPLHYLVEEGGEVDEDNYDEGLIPVTLQKIKMLILAGAKLDITDEDGCTPLQRAELIVKRGSYEGPMDVEEMGQIISLLRDYEQRMLQAEQKAGKIVPALEVALFDQSDNNHSPLAILPGDLCLLKEITGLAKETILQEAREPRQEDQRCCKSIFQAAEKGDLDCVKRFIEEDPTIVNRPINSGGLDADYYPLHYAASAGRIDVVRELIRSGARVNNDHACDTPLHAAVRKGSIDVVWALIANGADVNATDYSGFTPLHYAIMRPRGHLKIIKALIGAGASLDIRNNDGDTPLGLVRKRQDAEDVLALISNK